MFTINYKTEPLKTGKISCWITLIFALYNIILFLLFSAPFINISNIIIPDYMNEFLITTQLLSSVFLLLIWFSFREMINLNKQLIQTNDRINYLLGSILAATFLSLISGPLSRMICEENTSNVCTSYLSISLMILGMLMVHISLILIGTILIKIKLSLKSRTMLNQLGIVLILSGIVYIISIPFTLLREYDALNISFITIILEISGFTITILTLISLILMSRLFLIFPSALLRKQSTQKN